MAKLFHDAAEAAHRNFDSRPRRLALDQRVRDMRRIGGRKKFGVAVEIRDAIGMEYEFLWDLLLREPLDGPRRGVKGMHANAEAANQFQVERNFLANANGINDAGWPEAVRTNAPARTVVSQRYFFVKGLDLLQESTPQ